VAKLALFRHEGQQPHSRRQLARIDEGPSTHFLLPTRCPTFVCWPQTRFGSSLVILAFHEDDKIKWRMSSLTYFSTGLAQMEGCSTLQVCRKAEKRKNTRRAEKRIQRTAWILSHVLRTTLCEHGNGLCPAGWLNEQSITKHWFQSVRTVLVYIVGPLAATQDYLPKRNPGTSLYTSCYFEMAPLIFKKRDELSTTNQQFLMPLDKGFYRLSYQ